ncbi:hypothetical protein M0R72_19435 [Candidatus Pacearchaeota archaeon]|nr:hypothetical protein [Candidatus Pacearchaeota archaeon]
MATEEEYNRNRTGKIGRCIHWSGCGCTFPDSEASLVPDQDEGYYEGVCPRKDGAGCSADGHFEMCDA